jgi:hypothetical protein
MIVSLTALLCCLSMTTGAQTLRPVVPYQALLGITLFTRAPEAMLGTYELDVAFAPEGNFPGKVVIRSGEKVLAELPTRVTQRMGTMARVAFRGLNVKLGADDGPRSIEVVVAGEAAGRLDFTLTKRVGGDAFAPTVTWLVGGPWLSHAHFVHYAENTRQQRVRFVYWATASELGGVPKGMLELVMKRGNTVLATAEPREVSSTDVMRKEQELRLPDRQVFLAEHLARMSGPFTVELRYANRVVKAFQGEIANGMFVPHPLSVVPAPDRSHFLSPRAMGEHGGTMNPDLFSWVTLR